MVEVGRFILISPCLPPEISPPLPGDNDLAVTGTRASPAIRNIDSARLGVGRPAAATTAAAALRRSWFRYRRPARARHSVVGASDRDSISSWRAEFVTPSVYVRPLNVLIVLIVEKEASEMRGMRRIHDGIYYVSSPAQSTPRW